MVKNIHWILVFLSAQCVAFTAAANNKSQSNVHKSTNAPVYHFAAIEKLVEQQIGEQVLPLIYQSIDINIQITSMPASRAEAAATKGLADGEIMRIWTYGDENPELIRVPTPYYSLETMPFVLKNSGIVIHTKADLKPYRIAKVRGVKHTNNITQGLPFVFESNNTENMFKLLRAGKVDVVLTNTLDGLIVLNNMAVKDIIPMTTPLKTLPLFHYIHHSKAAIVPKVDNAIKQLKKSGELEKMIKHAEHKFISSL